MRRFLCWSLILSVLNLILVGTGSVAFGAADLQPPVIVSIERISGPSIVAPGDTVIIRVSATDDYGLSPNGPSSRVHTPTGTSFGGPNIGLSPEWQGSLQSGYFDLTFVVPMWAEPGTYRANFTVRDVAGRRTESDTLCLFAVTSESQQYWNGWSTSCTYYSPGLVLNKTISDVKVGRIGYPISLAQTGGFFTGVFTSCNPRCSEKEIGQMLAAKLTVVVRKKYAKNCATVVLKDRPGPGIKGLAPGLCTFDLTLVLKDATKMKVAVTIEIR